MATIQFVKARQIFDSRGNLTVEADVGLSNCTWARAAVPSGTSTRIYEALVLRDGGSDYLGKGVSKSHPGGLLFTKFGSIQTALLDLAFRIYAAFGI